MTFRVVVSAAAEADFLAATQWYAERAPEQIPRLIDEYGAAIERIAEAPHVHPPLRRGVRRAALKVFRYQLWFRIDEEQHLIEILALVHGRQDREGFNDRLG